MIEIPKGQDEINWCRVEGRWTLNGEPIAYGEARNRWDMADAHWTMSAYHEMSRLVVAERKPKPKQS